MTDTTVLTTDMAILVGIFLVGFLAKMFPRTGHRERAADNSKRRSAMDR
jgi:hypothetical protein